MTMETFINRSNAENITSTVKVTFAFAYVDVRRRCLLCSKVRFIEWETVSASAKELLSQLLTVDPEERILGQEALEHAWFDSLKQAV